MVEGKVDLGWNELWKITGKYKQVYPRIPRYIDKGEDIEIYIGGAGYRNVKALVKELTEMGLILEVSPANESCLLIHTENVNYKDDRFSRR